MAPAGLSGDRFDLELGVVLPMSLVLLVVLATTHLEDLHLVAAAVRDHRRRDARAGDDGLAEAHAVALADQQHLVEHDARADFGGELLDLEFLAGRNLVLLAAGLDHRIHVNAPESSRRIARHAQPRRACRTDARRMQGRPGKVLKYNGFCDRASNCAAPSRAAPAGAAASGRIHVRRRSAVAGCAGPGPVIRSGAPPAVIPDVVILRRAPLSPAFLSEAVAADMAAVDAVLRESLDSDVALVRRIADYIVAGGGKRLRPI